MTEKEEHMLRQNAQEVQQQAESLQEMKIYNAMKEGIEQGKRREKRRRYSYGLGGAVAAAAAVLLTFSLLETPISNVAQEGVVQEPGITREMTGEKASQNWSDSELFRTPSIKDPSFVTALDRNLIQPVYKSVEKNGLEVEVLGAVTDGRKVFVLHSIRNNTDQEVSRADATLDNGAFEVPSIGAWLDIIGRDYEIPAGQTSYYVYYANLDPAVSYTKEMKFQVILTGTSPEALASSSNKYRTSLDIGFELDPLMFEDQKHTFYPDRTLTLGGQHINVHQVLYTPISTYVDLEYDPANSKYISELINPVLINKRAETIGKLYYPGKIYTYNSVGERDKTKATLVFKASEYNPLNSLSLKAFGISASDKAQMQIVIDLNKREILESPENGLVIAGQEKGIGAGDILFRKEIGNAQWLIHRTEVDDSFIDAKGQIHKRQESRHSGGYTITNKSGAATDEIPYNFGEEAQDYPQPLTLKVLKYDTPIMDTQAVELPEKK
ncbi:hypothetical protein GCM10010912_03750 [Paenibacillus albidus]|uniref:DUF4179 domain-containing protein n=1 Tax=Paenibacillus albidus TaxID=2041023 RepID=A0A917BYG3_9BACL|nr:DUF4179 domain-containing protein [Paenibacillus albidus]GGF61856.1 hypothetical protein GCM10010912_03750 [Paenibacillus albidus]